MNLIIKVAATFLIVVAASTKTVTAQAGTRSELCGYEAYDTTLGTYYLLEWSWSRSTSELPAAEARHQAGVKLDGQTPTEAEQNNKPLSTDCTGKHGAIAYHVMDGERATYVYNWGSALALSKDDAEALDNCKTIDTWRCQILGSW